MQRQVIQVPRSFRALGRWQRDGETSARWLAVLPDIVAEQCAKWNLRLDGEPMHGDNGLAVPVLRDGEPLVLKVSWPDHLVAEQALALQLWDGQGIVRLFEVDVAAGTMLLERLDDRRTLSDLPLDQAVPIIGALLRRLAIPAPDGHRYRTTAGVAAELHESLRWRWESTGRPFTPQVLDAAVGLAEELSTGAPAVMVDSDLHYEQVLGGRREPWLVIDPLVLVGDIEYQCTQLLWTRFDEMRDGARLRWCLDALVEAAALDPARAHAWTVLRAVDYCIWGLAVGFTEDPVRCQRIVEALL
jgi:streptomycin 6-kinase